MLAYCGDDDDEDGKETRHDESAKSLERGQGVGMTLTPTEGLKIDPSKTELLHSNNNLVT